MSFAGATIFRVHKRLRDLFRHPRLFDDRFPPRRVMARRERFRRWCGPMLWQILCTCEVKGTEPAADVQKWRKA